MKRRLVRGHRRLATALVAALVLIEGRAVAAGMPASPSPPGEMMLTPEKGFPKLAFPDSTVTPNNHCPVTGHQLNAEVHPVYVNGVPIGFC
jgi:hypothetical protein